MTEQALVKLENIQKIFSTDRVKTHALNNINLNINKGEYVSISGPSGCGKSTLLSLLGLLDVPSSGSYHLAGHDVTKLSRNQRASIRNLNIGFIFQSFNLISGFTVEENVALPLIYRKNITKESRGNMVRESLEKVDLTGRNSHFPSQLSGGQQQRVAIARAIVGSPSLILADEPTGNLDSHNAEIVMSMLDMLHSAGSTLCLVSHDPRSIERAKRKIEILDGKII